jgi:hypothetical protein
MGELLIACSSKFLNYPKHFILCIFAGWNYVSGYLKYELDPIYYLRVAMWQSWWTCSNVYSANLDALRNEKNDYECLLRKKRLLKVLMQRKFVSGQLKLDEEQHWNEK